MQERIEQRLVELETRVAYQEEAQQVLGAELARQRRALEQLEQRCRLLQERILSQTEPAFQGSARDEIPPHY